MVGWFPSKGWILEGLRIPDTALDSTRGPAASEVSSLKASVHWCWCGVRVDPDSRWLPKIPALTLAKSRASPSRIRKCPERNQKLHGQALDPRWTPARTPGSTENPVTGPAPRLRGV